MKIELKGQFLVIVSDHEPQFAMEMKKYVNSNMSLPHSQSVIRQLVSTNVLLKEQLDKQTEEKKLLRKKLLQMEKMQSDKDKFLAKKEQDIKALNERLKKLEHDFHHRAMVHGGGNNHPAIRTSTPKSTFINIH